jgi:hypothetical protein
VNKRPDAAAAASSDAHSSVQLGAHSLFGRSARRQRTIDLIGVPWLMIGEEPSAAPNAAALCAAAANRAVKCSD